jgi:hypothetical protein
MVLVPPSPLPYSSQNRENIRGERRKSLQKPEPVEVTGKIVVRKELWAESVSD